jgi:hypothetical protein
MDLIKQIKETIIEREQKSLNGCVKNAKYLKQIINDSDIIGKQFNDEMFFNMFFDKIYVLSLKRLEQKWINTQNRLNIAGIYNFDRFFGYDCKNPEIIKEYQILKKEREEKKKDMGITTIGSYAILKSIKRMIEHCKKRNYKSIVIFQDDVILSRNFCKDFYVFYKRMFLDKTTKKYKLIYLGASQHKWEIPEETKQTVNDFKKNGYYNPWGTTDGAFAVIVHCSAYDDILKEVEKKQQPIDSGALSYIQRRYPDECFVCFSNLAISDVEYSELRGARSMLEVGQRFKWDFKMFDDLAIINNVL